MKRLRLLIVDDHPIVREGLRACLEREKDFEVVGEAGDGNEALEQARALTPDLVLMDIRLPNVSGMEATRQLCAEFPGIRVLALSMYHNKQLILEVIKSGAQGYVLKDAPLDELIQAIRAIHRGEQYYSQDVTRVLANDISKQAGNPDKNRKRELSRREQEVLALIAEGLSSRDIAKLLGVSVRTVQTHREHIMKKLDIHSATGLTKYALREGIIPSE